MKKNIFVIMMAAGIISCQAGSDSKTKGPAKVTLEQTGGKHRLFVNGEEFYVKGAGLEFGNIELLASHGANSFRTWRTANGQEDAMEVLDRAQKNGLMVLMGLEVGRERHGFDYNDTVWVRRQLDSIKADVVRLKDHPALLGWAIGNELNLGADNLRIYDAVNDISEMIHETDTNHVTTTTLAGIGKREIDYIRENCTDIDFISIQMYGDIVNLQKRIADAGWEGPYMVTEWGATGHWEVYCTPWKACIEQTSREKAEAFTERYRTAIEADSVNCLGSYVFLWGQKQERTPTWYGMFLETGEETETVDAMHYIWTGKWPENRCPVLDSLKLNGKTGFDNIVVSKGEKMNLSVMAHDIDKDILTYSWEIMPESTDLGWGGDHEKRPETIIRADAGPEEIFDVPAEPGAYRIYVYVKDGKNHAATANIPFFVEED